MTEKRFTLGKDYDSDGNYEYCYQDEETGRIFNFADDYCHTDFLELVNAVVNNLKEENRQLHRVIAENKKENKELREEVIALRHIAENIQRIKSIWGLLSKELKYR